MRSLKSFLLEEAMIYENKTEPPRGFKRFSNKGPITNQLKDLLASLLHGQLKIKDPA